LFLDFIKGEEFLEFFLDMRGSSHPVLLRRVQHGELSVSSPGFFVEYLKGLEPSLFSDQPWHAVSLHLIDVCH
jgi:hypothetical protein